MKEEILKELESIDNCTFLSCLLNLIRSYKKKSGI
nr:MAG TPA: hypothetical protein [Caudoviricetes sp.]